MMALVSSVRSPPRVHQQQDGVGVVRAAPGGVDHRALEAMTRGEDAGRVDEDELHLVDHTNAAQPAARGLHLGRDDGDLGAHQTVDQRRLADIGRPQHGDEARAGAGPQPSPSLPASGNAREQRAGGALLGCPLGGACADCFAQPGDLRLDLEERGVGGAAGRQHPVDREPERPRLRPFLELGLGIARRFGVGVHRRRPVAANEALGGFDAAVDIEGAYKRLAGIRQIGRIVASAAGALAAAQRQPVAEREAAGHALQRLAADERRVPLGKRALGLVRECLVQHRRHDHAEHAVAEEFEALVAARLRTGARMAERESEQRRAREAVAESLFERARRCGVVCRGLGRRLSCACGR